jgi:hypothetical protein
LLISFVAVLDAGEEGVQRIVAAKAVWLNIEGAVEPVGIEPTLA